MGPEREAGEEPAEGQRAAGLAAVVEAAARPDRQQQDEAAEDQGGGVEGRGQGGQQDEVRRAARHEHRRRKRRRGMEGPRQAVRDRDEGQAQEEHGQPQGLGGRAPHGDEGDRHPGVEGRPVGLPPEGRALPRVTGHEAHDGGVAVHRGPQRLDPEGDAHREGEEQGQGDGAGRAHGVVPPGSSAGVSVSDGLDSSPPRAHAGGHGSVAQVSEARAHGQGQHRGDRAGGEQASSLEARPGAGAQEDPALSGHQEEHRERRQAVARIAVGRDVEQDVEDEEAEEQHQRTSPRAGRRCRRRRARGARRRERARRRWPRGRGPGARRRRPPARGARRAGRGRPSRRASRRRSFSKIHHGWRLRMDSRAFSCV